MPDDYTSDTQTTGAVELGAWVEANLGGISDVDWFAVDLVAGKTYSFVQAPDYTLEGGGHLPDPEIQGIYDAAGNSVPTEIHQDWRNNSTSSRVYFRPDADGKYFIGAGGVDSGRRRTPWRLQSLRQGGSGRFRRFPLPRRRRFDRGWDSGRRHDRLWRRH